ncbi:uncharacterized protein DUF1499 [Humitalea rosea]|uniref:Uncharacterized protein DUF1499 n=1 Tax=Humitalea rosea TaxID=990373 RepID=A0A2W7IPN6_9PROT|nr:DUF1499 domain-containing protein [Humitalea rosea]PZW41377.1 uncharacterized protein DUF1499 [Humitalea rosea]
MPNALSLLFGSGAGGLGAPVPLDLANLVLPGSPNTCLAAPEGAPGPKPHRILAPFPVGQGRLWAAVQTVAAARPRTTLIAAWPERLQAQWVERSALMNYPDIIVAQLLPQGDAATGLALYSRSLLGHSDFGVNARRVEAWIAALTSQLS